MKIEPSRDYSRLIRELRAKDPKLSKELNKAIRKLSNPLRTKVRRAVKALPAKGMSGSTGLRKRVAKGVGRKLTSKKGLRLTTSMPDAKEAALPRGLDFGWRAPFFGDRTRWFDHSVEGSWFIEPLGEEQDKVKREIVSIMDRYARHLRSIS